MEINIKHECNYEYKITLKVHESDFKKLIKIFKNITFQFIDDQLIGDSHYLVELNMEQLKYILKCFLDKIEWLEKTLEKYDNN